MNEDEEGGHPAPNFDYFGGGRKELDTDAVKYTLDTEDSLEQVRHYLLAERFEYDTGRWVTDFNAEPLMTKEGVNDYIGLLRTYVDRSNMLSNLQPERINILMIGLGQGLRPFFAANYKTYNIRKCNFTKIYTMTMDRIELCLRRAEKNGERLRLMSQMHHNVVEQKIQDDTKKKRFGLF